MRVRTVLLALCLLAAAAPSAQALTRKQATALALAELQPDKIESRTGVVVYGRPTPVHAGHAVWAFSVPRNKKSIARYHPRKLKADAWLYWMDPMWGARFGHPSRMVLIDDKSGKVVRRTLRYWPMIDKKPVPFATWGRRRARFQVFSDVPGGSTSRWARPLASPVRVLARQAASPFAVPEGALDGDCIVTIGESNDVGGAATDAAGILKLGNELNAAKTGLQVYKVKPDKYTDVGNGPADPGGGELDELVDKIAFPSGDCDDIMIYISGAGVSSKEGEPGVVVGETHVMPGEKGAPVVYVPKVEAGDLATLVKEHSKRTFKIKIDASYSGRFLQVLSQKQYPNILVLEASSAADEPSYYDLKAAKKDDGTVVNDTTTNPGRSEATNGNLAALREFFTSGPAVERATIAGGALLAQALTYAAQNSKASDFASQMGLTHPPYYSDQVLIPGSQPPDGSRTTLGSALQAPATQKQQTPVDRAVIGSKFHPVSTARTVGSADGAMPADGQILAVRVKGTAIASGLDGAPAPLTEIHFSSVRPQPDGSVTVIVSSQAFNLPVGGDPNQITTYVPENFCVAKGDYLVLSTEGGFEPTFYPDGVDYQVFSDVADAQIRSYAHHNGVMNGAQFTPTTQDGVELLMQWDLGTGDQATALCPGGTKT